MSGKSARQRGSETGGGDGQVAPFQVSDARARVEAAALKLFSEKNAAGTTVRDITKACGLTPGALYAHFESKEELLYSIIDSAHADVENRVLAALERVGDDDPRGALRAVVETYVQWNINRRDEARVTNRDFRALSGTRLEQIRATRRRHRDRITSILLDGERAGVFRLPAKNDERKARILAITIIDMCTRIPEWYRQGGPLREADISALYSEVAFRIAGVEVVAASSPMNR